MDAAQKNKQFHHFIFMGWHFSGSIPVPFFPSHTPVLSDPVAPECKWFLGLV
jgi:hypothetical protein